MTVNTSLYISQSGLNGLQKNLDITANNIANVNTIGFKQKDGAFQELLVNNLEPTEVPMTAGLVGNTNRGLQVDQNNINFAQGGLTETKQPFDLALAGDGFFSVTGRNGERLLTRDGAFSLDNSGELQLASGEKLDVNYLVPAREWPQGGKPFIGTNGMIVISGQTVGQIPVFTVDNPSQLVATGDNKYRIPDGLNVVQAQNPQINQGFLENSTVDLASSMTDMIVTQRAYSMNAKVLQATDEMMQRINEFKK
ncbi:hypothetical protein CBF34_01095 [Vagococcus penaei]|uniref:Uncharacterized protein n=1 Tax=Vagococcus penaei TaxID=633807 RepID=A0A1Q2D861_9ENTE|nr:flagellar hook-basal body protein [Vagococcus penaei]AQP54579.1 hypothetical protein BW732_10445 [Vagococcus penaei]RSU06709.1 hypothetical protein CBF34_01095 [Vagococcus penaei]